MRKIAQSYMKVRRARQSPSQKKSLSPAKERKRQSLGQRQRLIQRKVRQSLSQRKRASQSKLSQSLSQRERLSQRKTRQS